MNTDLKIDLNCDLGESFGIYNIGHDEEIIPYISSANIACGFHAGDPATMKRTVQQCLTHDVAIGAHPGLPDLHGFGRREIAFSAEQLYDIVLYQIGALQAFIKAEGGTLHHVKPHGALYHMTIHNDHNAAAVAEAIYKIDPTLIVYGFPESALLKEARRIGLHGANEAFVDRAYSRDGTLLSRQHQAAMINDIHDAVAQAIDIVKKGKVKVGNGDGDGNGDGNELITIQADTLCIHGDGTHALQLVKLMTTVFEQQNIVIKAMHYEGGES